MAGNKRFYDQLRFILAKFDGKCPECNHKINKGEPIVHMLQYKITMHLYCFRHGPQLHPQDKLLSGTDPRNTINFQVDLKARFMILLYRLINSKGFTCGQKTHKSLCHKNK